MLGAPQKNAISKRREGFWHQIIFAVADDVKLLPKYDWGRLEADLRSLAGTVAGKFSDSGRSLGMARYGWPCCELGGDGWPWRTAPKGVMVRPASTGHGGYFTSSTGSGAAAEVTEGYLCR